MNAIKLSIGLVCAASLSFAQIPSDTEKSESGIKISKSITFQYVNVDGNKGNGTTVFVHGSTLVDTMDLKLSRSFKQELSSNVDKETVERMF